jgi:ATP-dependent Lon protease
VLIPNDNEKDLEDIPDNVKTGLQIVPVSTVDEVLKHALTLPLTAITWTEEEEGAEARRVAAQDLGEESRPH